MVPSKRPATEPENPPAACSGSLTIAAVRKLAPDKAAERKILFENSKKLFMGRV